MKTMAEYFTSLTALQTAFARRKAARATPTSGQRMARGWLLQPAATATLLLLAAVACTSPAPTLRGTGATGTPSASQAADIRSSEPTAAAISGQPDASAPAGYPRQVALLLPLSGRLQAAGVAVRDGFLASVLAQDVTERPTVNIYDSAALGATAAYARAISEGAQFVVGPLTKEEVQAVADSGSVSVPSLGLNYLPDSALPPGLLFQFALDPEDEARQVARRAIADGHTHGVALVPDNEWGQRLLRAFDAEFAAAGGTLVGRTLYDTAARDYSQPITRLLLIDQSRTRASALSAALGTRLEFEPRSRSDVQFVFIGAQPLQGRSLRPALRFHLPQDLPVYATSDVFELDSEANADLDGVIFPDMPWIVAPDATANNLRQSIASYWPARSKGRGRLYAFGYDAFQLIPVLRSSRPTATPLGGMTGRLVVDDRGRVRRELDWAQVENGRPRAIAVVAGGGTAP